MAKTITMTLFNRPQYTKIVLENLLKCTGIQDYTIIIFIEPGNKIVIDIAKSLNFNNKQIFINKTRFGCNKNIFTAINEGFKYSDYNIHLEDDICPGRDMLTYFEFCDYRYRYETNIFSICAYNKLNCQEKDYDKVFRNKWFTPWGWATWIDRWEIMKSKWNFGAPWDIHVHSAIMGDKYEIKPFLARTQNIGKEFGTNASPDYYMKMHYNEFWVNSTNYSAYNFFEEPMPLELR